MLKSQRFQSRDIHPLTDFLRNSKTHIQHLQETGGPEILTVNGKAAVVIQDAASYEKMLARVERAELVESLREAHAEMRDGKGIPFETLKAQLLGRRGL